MKRLLAWTGAYGGLILLSVAYLLAFKWWDVEVSSRHGLGPLLSAAGSGAIFWALAGGLVYYLRRLDRFGRLVFAGLAGAFSVVLLLFWPGLYDSDSIAGIHNSAFLPFDDWLGNAPIIQRAILRHLPWLGAITWIQLVFSALAIAYGCQTLKSTTRGVVAPALMVALSLLSAPLLYALMLVSRETWLSVVTLFLAIECVLFFADPDWRDGRVVGRMLALGAVAAFFRSEALLYVLAVGLVVVARIVTTRRGPRIGGAAVFRAIAPFAAIFVVTRLFLPVALPASAHPGAYDLSLWIGPVGEILNSDPSGLDPADVATIYGVVPATVFHDNWNEKSFNDKFWKPLTTGRLHPPKSAADRAKVRKAVIAVGAAEPGIFIANRVREFSTLDRPVAEEIAVQPTQAFIDSPRPRTAVADMRQGVRYDTIWPKTRRAIETAFVSTLHNPLGLFQWAVTPDLIFLALALVMFRVAPGFAFAAFVVAARAPALFLLMPAPQSKYYAPQEFALPFILAGVVVIAVQCLSQRRQGLQPA